MIKHQAISTAAEILPIKQIEAVLDLGRDKSYANVILVSIFGADSPKFMII